MHPAIFDQRAKSDLAAGAAALGAGLVRATQRRGAALAMMTCRVLAADYADFLDRPAAVSTELDPPYLCRAMYANLAHNKIWITKYYAARPRLLLFD